ncbi:sugar transferase [Mycolicibacterium iranicum]|uniref:sugar transferase n=1 Tax=Mycolicibacterium iranicum TaxID=912594 RepID=UPI000A15D926|nr:sugar transferase [Mycolicibacterium iranicum]
MAVRSAGNEWPTTSLATAVRDAVAPRSVARGSLGLLIKFSADLASACAASVVGLFWAHERGFPMPPIWMMACYAPMVLVIFAARSTYRRKLHNTLVGEFMAVQTTAALAAMLLLAGMVLTGVPGDLSDTITKVWLTTAFFLPAGRIAAILVTRSLRRHSHLQSPTLILGNGAIAYHLAKRFLDNPQFGILPVGLVDSDSPWTGAGGHDWPIPAVGTPATMAEAIQNTRAEAVVVAFSQARDEDLIPAIRAARLAGLTVWVVPRMFDTVGLRARMDCVGGMPVMTLSNISPTSWQFEAKHILDRLLAAAILTAISPLFVFLMVAVKASSPGSVFFRQPRIGRDGIVFDCLKFRSMRPPSDSDSGFVLGDGVAPGGVEGIDRRTWIGKLLRTTSLDELPQLLNVIKGEMSLVGPRPERPEFVEIFNSQIRRYGERHRVKAGMTGWAQVHGLRGQTSIADRAEWDNFYVENWSLGLDLQTLLMTVPAVLRPSEKLRPPVPMASNIPLPQTVVGRRVRGIALLRQAVTRLPRRRAPSIHTGSGCKPILVERIDVEPVNAATGSLEPLNPAG